jgi:hypothetical protein
MADLDINRDADDANNNASIPAGRSSIDGNVVFVSDITAS